jgi:hypothetical protein
LPQLIAQVRPWLQLMTHLRPLLLLAPDFSRMCVRNRYDTGSVTGSAWLRPSVRSLDVELEDRRRSVVHPGTQIPGRIVSVAQVLVDSSRADGPLELPDIVAGVSGVCP